MCVVKSLDLGTSLVGPAGFQWELNDKESTCKAGDTGDMGSIPGLERSPGGGNGNPLQNSCSENPMDLMGLMGYSS